MIEGKRENGPQFFILDKKEFDGYKKIVEKKPCFCNILVLKTKCYKTRLLNGSYYRIILYFG